MRFVFDLDGTLCFDGRTIAPEIREALATLKANGHHIVFATARSYRDCIALLGEDLAQEMVIGLNGGLLYVSGRLHWSKILDNVGYQRALSFCEQYDLPYFVDDNFDYASSQLKKMPFASSVDPLNLAVRKSVQELREPIKMVVEMSGHEDKLAFICEAIEQLGTLDISYHKHEKCLYINPLNTTKATTVIDQLGSDFVAFGNDQNDIDLFKAALYSVQVGDYEGLKAHADEQIEPSSSAISTAINRLSQTF